jgi:hypothetical protein
MSRTFYTDTATRHRAPAVAGIHGGTRDWAKAAKAPLTGLRFQPAGTEDAEDLATALNTYRLMGPIDIDLTGSDRVSREIAPGIVEWFEVIGAPQRFRSPYGTTSHSETMLKGIPHG